MLTMRLMNRIMPTMNHRESLSLIANSFAAVRGISLARVSTLVRNDGKFFQGIAAGKSCTTDTYEYCLLWFSNNWPEGATWPMAVSRPPRSDAAAILPTDLSNLAAIPKTLVNLRPTIRTNARQSKAALP